MQIQDPYGFFDGPIKWTSSDVLMSVSIDAVGQFLGTTTKKATVKLLGIVETAQAGDMFQVRLGLYNNDPSVYGFNNISEGFYFVDNIDYDYEAGSTTITMYDHMWRASNTPYLAANFTYPATVTELASQVADELGLDLVAGFSSLPNATFSIPSDLYAEISNATLQSVIQEIAASTGTSARVTDNTLVFSRFSVSSETLSSTDLKTLKIGKEYGPVTSVVLGRVPQNDNIYLANGQASSSAITSINTTTNLITIVANGMTNGTLVQVSSTATLPAPLQANTNYFVFTNGNADTFALTPTYADALAGTNKIDLTTAGTGTITLSQLQTQEVKINNIQILDNDRETLLPSLYASLLGVGWNEVKTDTVGFGWHEVGDVISFTQENKLVHCFLSEVHLVLSGSVRESLAAVIPDIETINYQTAGGILKTIYNTEIKVDKQNQSISSVVSQQQIYQNQTLEAFSLVYQTIAGVTTTIQSVGGGNLILNSVGYAKKTDGSLSFWDQSGTGTITAYGSAGSLASGGTSGNAIELVGNSIQIKQRVYVATTSAYSVGFRVSKLLGDGAATLTLSNDVTSYTITVATGTKYEWEELKLENITPDQNYWDVTLAVTNTTSKIEVTDLRILLGPTLSQWTQSQNEILNTQVALTTEGIRVSSQTNTGDYTVMTPLEFAGHSNVSGSDRTVFTVNKDTTIVAKLKAIESVEFGGNPSNISTAGIIRAIPIMTGLEAGLAFVGVIS